MSGLLDKVKDAVSKSGSSSTTTGNTAGAGTTTGTSGAAGSEDYGDKGLGTPPSHPSRCYFPTPAHAL